MKLGRLKFCAETALSEKVLSCSVKMMEDFTHVVFMVDNRVVVCLVAGVSMDRLYVVSPIVCVDGSLKLTL